VGFYQKHTITIIYYLFGIVLDRFNAQYILQKFLNFADVNAGLFSDTNTAISGIYDSPAVFNNIPADKTEKPTIILYRIFFSISGIVYLFVLLFAFKIIIKNNGNK